MVDSSSSSDVAVERGVETRVEEPTYLELIPDRHVYDRKSIKLELEPGEYYWCACGLSRNQPFCDGSHNKEKKVVPQKFVVENKEKKSYCLCKQVQEGPYCVGLHREIAPGVPLVKDQHAAEDAKENLNFWMTIGAGVAAAVGVGYVAYRFLFSSGKKNEE